MNYLDRAVSTLRTVGILFQPEVQEAPVLKLLDKVAKYDLNKVASIAATLQQSSAFNAVIREKIQGMEISTRFAEITTSFNSIRDDAAEMALWMADGKLDFTEKLKLNWMKLSRGSIPDRFNKIHQSYLEVVKSCGEQLEIEAAILGAYQDFRMALKSAEVEAQQVLSAATDALNQRKADLEAASAAVADATVDDQAARSALELKRDEALRAVQQEDESYQIIKDIADDLKVGYNTAEVVFARLQQAQTVKERLRQRSISFFSTNETVFSGLAAAFTSNSGLAEATNTLEAMKDGMGKSLEALATTGTDQLNQALRSGYGSTLKVESVKALADAVVAFQESSLSLIDELRKESTAAANEIADATETAKRRFTALVAKGQ